MWGDVSAAHAIHILYDLYQCELFGVTLPLLCYYVFILICFPCLLCLVPVLVLIFSALSFKCMLMPFLICYDFDILYCMLIISCDLVCAVSMPVLLFFYLFAMFCYLLHDNALMLGMSEYV